MYNSGSPWSLTEIRFFFAVSFFQMTLFVEAFLDGTE